MRKPKKVYLSVEIGRRGKDYVIELYSRRAKTIEHRNVDADNRTRSAAKRAAIEES